MNFTLRPKCCDVVGSSMKYFVARQQYLGNDFLLFHGNNEYFYMAHSYMPFQAKIILAITFSYTHSLF